PHGSSGWPLLARSLPLRQTRAALSHKATAMQLHYNGDILCRGPSMPSLIEAESTLTDRYQTTVPETVRRALQLGKRDRIRWAINADGQVLLQRADDAADPVLGRFLDFLAADMTAHPE